MRANGRRAAAMGISCMGVYTHFHGRPRAKFRYVFFFVVFFLRTRENEKDSAMKTKNETLNQL